MNDNTIPTVQPSTGKKSIVIGIMYAVLAAIVAGGAVYAIERNRNASEHKKLQTQVETLKSQVATLPTVSPTPLVLSSATPLASATPAATSIPTASPESCQIALQPTLANGNGTAGTYYYTLTLTNTGTTDCIVSNQRPTLIPRDANGTALGSVGAASSDLNSMTFLTVAPKGKIYSTLGFPDSGNFDPSTQCKAMKRLELDINTGNIQLIIDNIDAYRPGFTDFFCNNDLTATDFTTSPQN